MSAPLPIRIAVFLVLWVGLCSVSWKWLLKARLPALRQGRLRWIAVLFWATFVGMSLFLGLPAESVLIVGPFAGIVLWWNLKKVRFCPNCGEFNVLRHWKTRLCRKCQQGLEKDLSKSTPPS